MKHVSLRHVLVLAIFVLLPALLLVSCKDEPTAAPDQNSVISGIARDEQGYIVPNAFVEAIDAASARIAADSTDEFGLFSLTNMPADRSALRIRVTQPDFKPFSAPISSVSGSGTNGAVVLMVHQDSACGRLKLTITELANHQPIPGAEVRLKRNGTLVTTVTSDATGIVEFNYLMAGTYSLRIAKTGFKVIERSATIQFCDSTSMDIRMEPTGGEQDSCCHGILTVLPQGGTPPALLVGAIVKLTKGGAVIGQQTVGANGAIFDGLCPGNYAVRISKGDQYKVKELELALGCNETRTIDPVLEANATNDSCCHGSIQFTIVDSTTRAALNGATVKLWKGNTYITSQVTGGDNRGAGVVLFPNRCDGQYQISILRDGYTSREFGFTIGCNENYTHTLGLKERTVDSCRTAILRVRVKDSTYVDAGWLSGVTVTVMSGGMVYATGTTDGEGWFEATALTAPRSYTVTFSKSGFQNKTVQFTYNECKTIQETIRLAP
ncbi:MAG: carboxypeptidase regulatory-like domain-containing protein [Ignavibacteria bacterium]|nr:carboxypeptidase regulatory-like domain-containing protein [Ignavibacteria bacterium]